MGFINGLFYLCFIGLMLDYLLTGLVSLFFPQRARHWFEYVYGIRLSEETRLLLKPWGILGLFTAAAGILVLTDLAQYHAFLLLFAALLLARLVLRVVLARAVHERFKLSERRNIRQLSILLLCFLSILTKYLSL